MASSITRRKLYELVWTRPVTKVAEELGISDVALHKICKKNRVPKPEIEIEGERVPISISEQLNRIPHVPTAAEPKRKADWEKAKERAARRGH